MYMVVRARSFVSFSFHFCGTGCEGRLALADISTSSYNCGMSLHAPHDILFAASSGAIPVVHTSVHCFGMFTLGLVVFGGAGILRPFKA
jgi:hypothetical protein